MYNENASKIRFTNNDATISWFVRSISPNILSRMEKTQDKRLFGGRVGGGSGRCTMLLPRRCHLSLGLGLYHLTTSIGPGLARSLRSLGGKYGPLGLHQSRGSKDVVNLSLGAPTRWEYHEK